VKIEPNCVVKWKGAILIELQHGFRRFQSTYLAEISRFAMLRPSWPDASGCGHRFFMSFEPPSSKRDQMVNFATVQSPGPAVFRIDLVTHGFGDVAMLSRPSGRANVGCCHG